MMKPFRLTRLLAAMLTGLCSLASCSARTGAVLPQNSAPGDTIIVRTTEVVFTTPGDAHATIAGLDASVVRVLGPHEAEILVPDSRPGATNVVVESGGRSESVPVEVTPNRFQRLVVTVESDRVVLDVRQPANTAPVSPQPSEGRLLAYEIVSPQGEVIFRGTVRNPLYARHEVFGAEGEMRQTSPPKRAAVAVLVPIVPEGSVVRFTDVLPTTTKAAVQQRVLGEFPVGGSVP